MLSLDQDVDQRRKGLGLAQREQPGRRLVGRAAAADHIGRDRPGRTTEADQGLFGRQSLPAPARSVSKTGARWSSTRSGFSCVERLGCHRLEQRTFPSLEAHLLAQRIGNDQDIGKQDRRIEIEAPQAAAASLPPPGPGV